MSQTQSFIGLAMIQEKSGNMIIDNESNKIILTEPKNLYLAGYSPNIQANVDYRVFIENPSNRKIVYKGSVEFLKINAIRITFIVTEMDTMKTFEFSATKNKTVMLCENPIVDRKNDILEMTGNIVKIKEFNTVKNMWVNINEASYIQDVLQESSVDTVVLGFNNKTFRVEGNFEKISRQLKDMNIFIVKNEDESIPNIILFKDNILSVNYDEENLFINFKDGTTLTLQIQDSIDYLVKTIFE